MVKASRLEPARRGSEREVLAERPLRDVMVELGVVTLFWTVIIWLAVQAAAGGDSMSLKTLAVASTWGMAVIEQMSSGLGTYITVILGFYVVVISRQYVGDSRSEHKNRRDLGAIGLMVAGSLLPALALAIIGCSVTGEKAGALVFLVPLTILAGFLAVRLRVLGVIEKPLRLANAIQTEEWARLRLAKLPARSTKNVLLIILWNVFPALAVGLLASVVINIAVFDGADILARMLTWGIWFFFGAVGLVAATMSGYVSWFTADSRSERVMAWYLPVSISLAALVATTVLPSIEVEFVAAIGTFVVMLWVAMASLVRGKEEGEFLTNWSLRGGSAERAKQRLCDRQALAKKEIEELTLELAAEEPQSPVARLLALLRRA